MAIVIAAPSARPANRLAVILFRTASIFPPASFSRLEDI